MKTEGEGKHVQVFDLDIHGCRVVVQSRAREEA